MILDELAPDMLQQVDDRSECEWLLDHLSDREAKIMWDHYALEVPVWMLARREGVSRARVWQIIDRAKRRLRGPVIVEQHRSRV